VTTSEDEAILNYVRVDPTGARTLAVDKNNNLWVGGYGNFVHQAVDGVNGLLMSTSRFPLSGNGNHPGYCGLVDGYGYLWSVSSQVPWPYDSSLLFQTSTGAYTPITTADHDYGIAIDIHATKKSGRRGVTTAKSRASAELGYTKMQIRTGSARRRV